MFNSNIFTGNLNAGHRYSTSTTFKMKNSSWKKILLTIISEMKDVQEVEFSLVRNVANSKWHPSRINLTGDGLLVYLTKR